MTQVIQDRYQIEEELGKGGMGIVYKAYDLTEKQTVVVKQLHDSITTDMELIERFKREGEILRKLDHPNIVKFLGALEQDGKYYLILEFVTGGNLDQYLKRVHYQLELSKILKIALDLANALTLAHREEVIHRDIKPSNILLADDETIRLADFGIARMKYDKSITETGRFIGSFAYSSPEQLKGESIDSTTDIWSFGVMLYEMLAGGLPLATFAQIPPDFSKIRNRNSPALIDLIDKMLQIEPTMRIPTMRQVALILEAVITAHNNLNMVDLTKIPATIPPKFQFRNLSSYTRPLSHIFKVMISSTSLDLPLHRQEAIVATNGREMLPLFMETLPASPYGAIEASLNLVNKAEIYVGMFADRYGFVPFERNPQQISITEMEYRRALERDIPILIFIQHDSIETPPSGEPPESRAKLVKLKHELREKYVVNFFKSPIELGAQVFRALTQLREKFIGQEPTPTKDVDLDLQKTVTPQKPRLKRLPKRLDYTLFGRQELLLKIKADLIAGKSLALQGIPGIGKTGLATAIAYDFEIAAHFDGIIWIELGRDFDTLTKLGEFCEAVGILADGIRQLTGIDERQTAIRERINDKRVLIVIDDIWPDKTKTDELEKYDSAFPLRLGGDKAVYLITSHVPAIVNDFVGYENVIKVGPLSKTASLEMIESFAPFVTQNFPELSQKMVDAVHGWPFGLNVTARRLRQMGGDSARIESRVNSIIQDGARQGASQYDILKFAINDLDETSRKTLVTLSSLFPARPNSFSDVAIKAISESDMSTIDLLCDVGLLETGENNRFVLNPIIADNTRAKTVANDSSMKMLRHYQDIAKKNEHQFALLGQEIINLRICLEIAKSLSEQDESTILFAQIANSLYYYWEYHSLNQEMFDTLAEAETRLKRLKQERERMKPLPDMLSILLAQTQVNLARYYDIQDEGDKVKAKLEEAEKYLDYLETQEAEEVRVFIASTRGFRTAVEGDFDAAEKIWQDGLQKAITINHLERIATLYSNLGLLKKFEGKIEESRAAYLKSLEFANSAPNKTLADVASLALQNLGALEGEQGNDELASTYFMRGIELVTETKNPERRALLFNNLGEVKRRQNNLEEAEYYLLESLKLAQGLHKPSDVRYSLYNLGALKLDQKKYDEAIAYLTDALKIAETQENNYATCGALNLLARANCLQGKTEEGISFLEHAKTVANSLSGDDAERRLKEISETSCFSNSD